MVTIILILIGLWIAFMSEAAKGGYVGTGGTILIFLGLAFVISIFFNVDFFAVIIFLLIISVLINVYKAIDSIKKDEGQRQKQQEEDVAKQEFIYALTTQLSQIPNYIELHDNYIWIDDTDFCWCDKTWKGLGKDFTIHRIPIDDIDYFIRFVPCSDIDNMPPLECRLGIIPNCNLFNNYSTKMIFIHDIHGNVIDFHYNDYSKLISLLPNKSHDSFKEKSLILYIQKTPYKAFTQLAKEIDDGNFGIKRDIHALTLLKKGYYPYELWKWENGNMVLVYLSLEELRYELTLEHSVYELDRFQSGILKIDELEKQSQKIQNNTSERRKAVNAKIKDYIWKHHHEVIVAAGAEAAFQRWSYRFD